MSWSWMVVAPVDHPTGHLLLRDTRVGIRWCEMQTPEPQRDMDPVAVKPPAPQHAPTKPRPSTRRGWRVWIKRHVRDVRKKLAVITAIVGLLSFVAASLYLLFTLDIRTADPPAARVILTIMAPSDGTLPVTVPPVHTPAPDDYYLVSSFAATPVRGATIDGEFFPDVTWLGAATCTAGVTNPHFGELYSVSVGALFFFTTEHVYVVSQPIATGNSNYWSFGIGGEYQFSPDGSQLDVMASVSTQLSAGGPLNLSFQTHAFAVRLSVSLAGNITCQLVTSGDASQIIRLPGDDAGTTIIIHLPPAIHLP